jgi:alkylation response protein AidB-like acyl-CoA dehydrogenase
MAAIGFMARQAEQRPDLVPVAEKLAMDCEQLRLGLVALTDGVESMSAGELRQRANSLALRSTQAALSAAKGAGFVAAHPAGRMAREALFFLVWSCPQAVVAANLCELAQLN